MSKIGIVIIGRNEGERLIRCFESLPVESDHQFLIVYVDSDSSDRSIERAKLLGIETVGLDASLPLTAARGRNAGFAALIQKAADLEYVQFMDGDCELLPGWLDPAIAALDQDQKLAIACGRRRERFPDATPYNRLADMEWNTPLGETQSCGGDALVRVKALQEVGGYNPALICGEEPELCIRLRQKGWKIRRLDADMTLHDIAMDQFGQWWKRASRFGWSVAEGKTMYGAPPENYMVRQSKSGWLWGLCLPLIALGLLLPTRGISLLLFTVYPLLMLRVYRDRARQGDLPADARLYAFFCVISKFPQLAGQLQYGLTLWQGKQGQLIEYKSTTVNDS